MRCSDVPQQWVAVPVSEDDSVRVRGGVRVEYEKDGAGVVETEEPKPAVGVEVSF